MSALEAICARFEIAVLLDDGCAHHLEAFDMQIDGATADGASAGHRNPGHSCARHQGTEHQGTGTHGLHDLVLRFGVRECAATDGGAVVG